MGSAGCADAGKALLGGCSLKKVDGLIVPQTGQFPKLPVSDFGIVFQVGRNKLPAILELLVVLGFVECFHVYFTDCLLRGCESCTTSRNF